MPFKKILRITSRRAGIVELAVELRDKKGREACGLCWAEGAVAAEFALSLDKKRIKKILLSEEATPKCRKLAEALAHEECEVFLLTKECFDKASVLKNPEGLGLMVAPRPAAVAGAALPKGEPIACLWQLQDPGNLGTIIRSAAAFGCRFMILVEPSVSPLNPQAVRASAGAALDMDFLFLSEEEALALLLREKDRICALSGDGNALNIDFCYNKSDELIVSGNEPHGLPKKVREALPLYSLPLKGRVESLNVTAASAIAYYLFWSLPPKRT
ncbi:RNA methyltransferase [bacterium]|nr:RNA methyltransferase [bacterium]